MVVAVIATESILCMILAFFVFLKIEMLYFFAFSIMFALLVYFLIRLKFLNYIELNNQGVKHKGIFYSWDNVYITADYLVPLQRAGMNRYVYQLYFADKYLTIDRERAKCRKEGFFFDLNEKRLSVVLIYYKKVIEISNESPDHGTLLSMIKGHNYKYEL